MVRYSPSHKARIEQAKRRKAFYDRMIAAKKSGNYSGYESYDSKFSEYRMRRLIPFALTTHALTLLFFILWMVSFSKSKVFVTSADFTSELMYKVEIPKDNTLYEFDVAQDFKSGATPMYSELEIELLDQDFDHVYSFYKDLWRERHPNDNGRLAVYSDVTVNFEIVLPKAGTYYLRPISHNNNDGYIQATVYKRGLGSLYFFYSFLIFAAGSFAFIVGYEYWGSPIEMFNALSKIRDLRNNRQFKIFAFICIFVFLSSVIAAFRYTGYAKGGDETVLPSKLYSKHKTIYLG